MKQKDLRSSTVKKTVSTATAAVAIPLQMKNSKQMTSASDIQQVIKLHTDALALVGHAHIHC